MWRALTILFKGVFAMVFAVKKSQTVIEEMIAKWEG